MASEPMEVLRWEDPPPATVERRTPKKTTRSRLEPIAEQLRGRPGEWAVVYEGERGPGLGMATHIRYGQVACFTPTGDFDATSRVRGGTTTVYARYVGDGEDW